MHDDFLKWYYSEHPKATTVIQNGVQKNEQQERRYDTNGTSTNNHPF